MLTAQCHTTKAAEFSHSTITVISTLHRMFHKCCMWHVVHPGKWCTTHTTLSTQPLSAVNTESHFYVLWGKQVRGMWYFPFSALTLLVGWQEGHLACKKQDVGLLVVTIWLELCTTYSSSSPVVTTTSIILCFNKHWLTQVHLENGERDVRHKNVNVTIHELIYIYI